MMISLYRNLKPSFKSRNSPSRRPASLGVVLAFVVIAVCDIAASQMTEPLSDELSAVRIDERLEQTVPLEARFLDSRGRRVRLQDFFGERPVLLTLTYSDCPMLCHLQLRGLVDSLKDLEWTPNDKFDIVNISIDPRETWQRAAATKREHLKAYGRSESAPGWHFLTGAEESIRKVADAVGFRYQYLPKRDEYAHAAATIVCTPEGVVSRYLYGVEYQPRTLRLSLVEAADGKVGTTLDRVMLFCFHYDAETGRYAPMAFRIMQLGGVLTLGTLLVLLVPSWLRRDKSSRDAQLKSAVNADDDRDESSRLRFDPLKQKKQNTVKDQDAISCLDDGG